MNAVPRLQAEIVNDYAEDMGLPPDVHYLGGARLRPVPPLDTRVDAVMILGAYPSARFEVVGGLRDVPVGDNLGPFEPERYFDGQRVRTQASADELTKHYLGPLGLDRPSSWITDLVKVFLFKAGHREKYAKLECLVPPGYNREGFEDLAGRSLPWLERELRIAKPRLLITLGAEVAGILRGVSGQSARNALLGRPATVLNVGESEVAAVHLAHPGIVMRGNGNGRNPWPQAHAGHITALFADVAKMKEAKGTHI